MKRKLNEDFVKNKKLVDVNDSYELLFESVKTDNLIQFKSIVDKKSLDLKHLINKENVLHFAIRMGSLKIFKCIVDEKLLDVTDLDNIGPNIFHRATTYGHLEIVKYIADKELVDVKAEWQEFDALYFAARFGHLDVLKYLVEEMGFKVTKLTLGAATLGGKLDVIKYIFDKELLDLDAKESIAAIINIAIKNGHLEILKYIVDKKLVDISYYSQKLLLAAQYGHLDIIKYLLNEKLANISHTSTDNKSIIHVAAQYGHLDIIKYLVDEGLMSINVCFANSQMYGNSLTISLEKCIESPNNTNFINIVDFLLEGRIKVFEKDELLLKQVDVAKYNSYCLIKLIDSRYGSNKDLDAVDFSKLELDEKFFFIKLQSILNGDYLPGSVFSGNFVMKKSSVTVESAIKFFEKYKPIPNSGFYIINKAERIIDTQKILLSMAKENKLPKSLIDKLSKFFEFDVNKMLFLEASLLNSFGYDFIPLDKLVEHYNSKFEDYKDILEIWMQVLPEYKEDFDTFLKDGSNKESFIAKIRASAGNNFIKILQKHKFEDVKYKEKFIQCLEESQESRLPNTIKKEVQEKLDGYIYWMNQDLEQSNIGLIGNNSYDDYPDSD
jgi:ankyrin repeat protein